MKLALTLGLSQRGAASPSVTYTAEGGVARWYRRGGTPYVSHELINGETLTVNSTIAAAEYLLAAGGGGGGLGKFGLAGGGGGAGELHKFVLGESDNTGTAWTLTPGDYTATVGAGGLKGTTVPSDQNPTIGGDTIFNGVTVKGGGVGGSNGQPASAGGSGGGAVGDNATLVSGGASTAAVGAGNAGGDMPATESNSFYAGGGGGAGSAGVTPDSGTSADGDGGAGVASAILDNASIFYCGGGGGARDGVGGSGVGGDADSGFAGGVAGDGVRGSGGGGKRLAGASDDFDSGAGGAGVVIVAYQVSEDEFAARGGV